MSRVVELETHCFGKSYAVKGSLDDDGKAENVILTVRGQVAMAMNVTSIPFSTF